MQPERRYLQLAEIEYRAAADGQPPVIRGYAAVFNRESEDLGGYREIIKPGTFTDVLNSGQDVSATIEHDQARLLGRRSSGTLRLMEDARGLLYEINPPDTTYARDLLVSMQRGDLRGASFGFLPAKGGMSWRTDPQTGQRLRELRSIRTLLDVSIVATPAYPDASAALRSYDQWAAEIAAEHSARRHLIARARLTGLR